MARFYDRVKHVETISGPSGFSLSSFNVVSGFVSFDSLPEYDSFASVYLLLEDKATGDWELGLYTESGLGFFSRNSGDVLESSNSGGLVSFAGNDVEISMVVPSRVYNFMSADSPGLAPKLEIGWERGGDTSTLSDRPGYTTFAHGDINNPNAVVLSTQGPKRSHQQVQVSKLRTSNAAQQPLYSASVAYADGGFSDYGVTHIEAVVTAIGSVSGGTSFEALAVRIEAAAVYRGGGVGTSAFLFTPTVTVPGSDGANAAAWGVDVDTTTPGTFTIRVTGDASSVVDWAARVRILGNASVPTAEA